MQTPNKAIPRKKEIYKWRKGIFQILPAQAMD